MLSNKIITAISDYYLHIKIDAVLFLRHIIKAQEDDQEKAVRGHSSKFQRNDSVLHQQKEKTTES